MTPKEILQKTKAYLSDRELWCQGHGAVLLYDGRVARCALSALSTINGSTTAEYCDGALAPLIKATKLHSLAGNTSIIDFNDSPNTTHEDIMRLFEKAIQIAEEDEKAN